MTNCKSFCRYRCPFFLLPPLPPCVFFFFFFLLLSSNLSSPPSRFLSRASISQHIGAPLFFFLFLPTRSFIFPPLLSGRCQLCRLARCCDKSSAPFISCHLRYTELENVHSPLLSSVSADSHLSTPSSDEQIRSKLGQVTQWWMNGSW